MVTRLVRSAGHACRADRPGRGWWWCRPRRGRRGAARKCGRGAGSRLRSGPGGPGEPGDDEVEIGLRSGEGLGVGGGVELDGRPRAGEGGAQRLEEADQHLWATNRNDPHGQRFRLGAGASAEQHGDGEEPCGPFFIIVLRGAGTGRLPTSSGSMGESGREFQSLAGRTASAQQLGFRRDGCVRGADGCVGVAVAPRRECRRRCGQVFGGGHAVEGTTVLWLGQGGEEVHHRPVAGIGRESVVPEVDDVFLGQLLDLGKIHDHAVGGVAGLVDDPRRTG